MKRLILALPVLFLAAPASALEPGAITIRTEDYPRPPYSGATYYVYERNGQAICTKLVVCNKFGRCQTSYSRGAFKDMLDVQTGAPYGGTPTIAIRPDQTAKHVCLTRFGLR